MIFETISVKLSFCLLYQSLSPVSLTCFSSVPHLSLSRVYLCLLCLKPVPHLSLSVSISCLCVSSAHVPLFCPLSLCPINVSFNIYPSVSMYLYLLSVCCLYLCNLSLSIASFIFSDVTCMAFRRGYSPKFKGTHFP